MLCQEGLCPQEGWHGLKMSDNVWRCRMCPNVSDKCLTWFAQPSTLILCRRHHWWSRTFCCPVASDICINSTGVDTSRETLRSQCQGESVTCDPKPARLVFWCLLTSYGVIAASTWMNNNAEKTPFNQRITSVIYCNLCIFMHDCVCIMLLLWSPIESAHNLAFSDSLVGRRIHYRTQSRIHTGLCDSACLQCWCRCNFRSQRCQMRLRQTQSTLSQTSLQKIIDNSVARHGLTKEHEDA